MIEISQQFHVKLKKRGRKVDIPEHTLERVETLGLELGIKFEKS